MRRLIVPLAAALVFASVAEASAPKSLTVTFAGSGGTEKDSLKMSFQESPTCTTHVDMTMDARDVQWRLKWSHVKLPKGSKPVKAKVAGEITGTSKLDATFTQDATCASQPPPPLHCDGPGKLKVKATVEIRRTPGGYEVETKAGDSEIATISQQASDDACADSLGLRTPALHAKVTLPRRSTAAVVTPVDAAANDSGPEAGRRHMEQHLDDEGANIEMTSDVAWSGVVTARFNRR
jgi:hypothetical protein